MISSAARVSIDSVLRNYAGEIAVTDDAIHQVTSIYAVDNAFPTNNNKFDDIGKSIERLSMLSRKYPRFCSEISFSPKNLPLEIKTDIWLIRFIEECYDYVTYSYTKYCISNSSSSSATSIRKNTLALAYPFPSLVFKYISNKYSCMNMRTRIVAEILSKIDVINDRTYFESVDAYRNSYISHDEIAVLGSRVQVFSQLLSESWDQDTLYIFLHSRASMQELFHIHFKNLGTSRIWREDPDAATLTKITRPKPARSSSMNDINKKSSNRLKRNRLNNERKVVPIELPSFLLFVNDLSLPEVPLLAIDHHHMLVLLRALGISSDVNVEYILENVKKSIYEDYRRWSTQVLCQKVESIVSANDFIGLGSSNIICFPLYSILKSLVDTWLALPHGIKQNFNSTARTVSNLTQLNSIYDNDCKLLKEHRNNVQLHEKLIAALDSDICRSEQQLKTIECRLQDSEMSSEALLELRESRTHITKLTLERLSLRSDYLAKRKALEDLQNKTELLWNQLMGSDISNKKKKRQRIDMSSSDDASLGNRWRVEAQETIARAVEYGICRISEHQIEASNAQQYVENSIMVQRTKNSLQEKRSHSPEIMQSRIRTLEREADELSTINITALKELGLLNDALQDNLRASISTSFNFKEELNKLYAQISAGIAPKVASRVIATAYTRVMKVQTIDRRNVAEARYQQQLVSMEFIYDILIDEMFKDIAHAALSKAKDSMIIDILSQACVDSAEVNLIERQIHDCISIQILLRSNASSIICNCVYKYIRRHRYQIMLHEFEETLATGATHFKLYSLAKLFRWHREFTKRIVNFKIIQKFLTVKKKQAAINAWLGILREHQNNRYVSEATRKRLELLLLNESAEKLKIGAASLQRLFRGYYVRATCRRKVASKQIVHACRVLICRNLSRKIKMHLVLRVEAAIAVEMSSKCRKLIRYISFWRKSFQRLRVIKDSIYTIQRVLCRKSFAKWHHLSILTEKQFVTNRLAAVKIQSSVRMLIVKVLRLNFFKLRRQIIIFQAIVRRWLIYKIFRNYILKYRKARVIQKRIRGFLIRKHMEKDKIKAMHHAAKANNYEKLKHFSRLFPHLISSLSEDGYTLMHSAAAGAARRTIKFLLKLGMDPNSLNITGCTPLHELIKSSAVSRDKCFDYIIDHGFNVALMTVDGKSSLLVAVEYGRSYIVRKLLEFGYDPNIPDASGCTCLQAACSNGNVAIVERLLENLANPNTAAAEGYFPLHFALNSLENVPITEILLSHGAHPDCCNINNFQSPLMTACSRGLIEVALILLDSGSSSNLSDVNGWSVAHFAAASGVYGNEMYRILLGADASFDLLDNTGNTPIHIACLHGSVDYLRCLLQGGARFAIQNYEGDYPTHIAARYNFVDCLSILCSYETDIGRFNYFQQTPMGCAQFHGSVESADFLNSLYRKLEEGPSDMNDTLDGVLDWKIMYKTSGERYYLNSKTLEESETPPTVASADKISSVVAVAPYLKKVKMIVERDAITKNEYIKDAQMNNMDIYSLSSELHAIFIIKSAFKKKIAYKSHLRHVRRSQLLKTLYRFLVSVPKLLIRVKSRRLRRVILIQSHWRGFHFRNWFYGDSGEYVRLCYHSWERKLAKMIYKLWKRYKFARYVQDIEAIQNAPKMFDDWQELVSRSVLIRTVGMIEEYHISHVFFYRHIITEICTFSKPVEIEKLDYGMRILLETQSSHAYLTAAELKHVIKIQSRVRSWLVRHMKLKYEKAIRIADSALENYLKRPDFDLNVFNYALYCQVNLNDYDRARSVHLDSLRRMEARGPDIPFVLFSYAIFSFFTHEADFSDVCLYLSRARDAEIDELFFRGRRKRLNVSREIIAENLVSGRSFYSAKVGFFHRYAEEFNTCSSWHQYACCLFLVFNDFDGCFEAFVKAFEKDALNKRLKENFNIMMDYYFGNDSEKKEEFMKIYMRNQTT